MHDLQLLNDHQLSNIFDTLLNDLTIHIQQHTQRRIELVLYENTKLKLEFFKKLGVDSSNQWILYDEQMEQFFKFLSGNITDANILTERQSLEAEEMQRREEWLSKSDRELKLLQIDSESPGLLSYKQQDVDALSMGIEAIEEASRDYATLLEKLRVLIGRTNECKFN